ncbi:hypothetical protein HanRHA438_Chr03g0127711 [Helianthus annuus]|nr:hypothetical protein HanIR_Chr03g0126721 [Helianthus annuus]KAJ0936165.1 hypothetical protein HanRHA438_Chr03g0127711 [Helianthus annuus]
MSSKTIFRSCGSSVRTLINRHILPTVTTTTIKTEPVANIYNWYYLLPNTFVPQPVNIAYGFGRSVAGESVLEEACIGRRTFATAKRNVDDESIDDELDDDEIEYEVSDEDDDDYEDDDDDDDHLVSDDD